jgi:hypothetical protein
MRSKHYRLAHMPDGIHAFTSWGPVLGPYPTSADADRAVAQLADSQHVRNVRRMPDCDPTIRPYQTIPETMPGYPEAGAQATIDGGTVDFRPGLPAGVRIVQISLADHQKYRELQEAAA